MKKALLFYTLLIIVSNAGFAQTQQGYVKTKGRMVSGQYYEGQRLSDVVVQVQGRTAVLSGKDGNFSFPVPGKMFSLRQVEKRGFILLDKDVLYRQYTYSANPLVIVMEDQTQLEADRRAIERQVRRITDEELQRRSEELEAMKEQNRITEEKYRNLLHKLNNDYDNNEQLIKDMVEEYNKIDFDALDAFHQRVSDCIINGRLEEADSLLRTKGSIQKQIESLNKHHAANEQTRNTLAQSEIAEDRIRQDIAQQCYSKFLIFKMSHQNDSAAYYIKTRASLDTTIVKWNDDAGRFLADYMADYTSALTYFEKNLRLIPNDNIASKEMEGHTYLNIGGIYEETGNYTLARSFFNKAIDSFLTIYDERSEDVATCHNCLGSSFSHSGDYTNATLYLQKSLEIRLAILGEKSKDVATTYNNLGCVYAENGHYSEAMDCFQKSLDIKSFNNDEDITTARGYLNMGSLLCEQGEYQKAIDYLTKAHNIEKLILGDYHPDMATLLNNLGYTYSKLGDYNKALDYYLETLNIRIRLFGEQYPGLKVTYNNIGNIYKKKKDYNNAIEYYLKSLNISKTTFGDNSPKLCNVYNNLGSLYLEMDEFPNALEYLNSAKDIYLASFGEWHPDLAPVYTNLGRVYLKMNEFSQAQYSCERAISILNEAHIVNPTLGITYGTLGKAWVMKGDYEKALGCYTQAVQILESKLGADNPTTKAVAADMINTQNLLKKNKHN